MARFKALTPDRPPGNPTNPGPMSSDPALHIDERHVRRNVVGGYIGRAAPILVGLITAPILTRYLDKDAFGYWTIVIGIVAVIPVGDLGVGAALTVRLAQALGKGERQEARKVLAAGLLLQVLLGLAMAAFCALVIPFIPWAEMLHVKRGSTAAVAMPTAFVMFVSYCLLVPLNIGQQVLIAYQENVRNSFVTSLGYVSNLVATVAFVALKLPLPWIAFAAAGVPGIVWLINDVVELKYRKRDLWPIRREDWDPELAKELLRMGLKLLGSQTFRVFLLSDTIIIGLAMTAGAAALYGQTQRFFFICSMGQYVANAWTPALAGSFARNEEGKALTFFRKQLFKFLGATLLLGLVLAPAIRLFLPWYLGPEYPAPGWDLVGGFVVWIAAWTLVDGMTAYASAGHYLKSHFVWLLVATVAATTAKFAFAASFGYNAIVWSSVICLLLLYVVPMFVRTRVFSHSSPA